MVRFPSYESVSKQESKAKQSKAKQSKITIRYNTNRERNGWQRKNKVYGKKKTQPKIKKRRQRDCWIVPREINHQSIQSDSSHCFRGEEDFKNAEKEEKTKNDGYTSQQPASHQNRNVGRQRDETRRGRQ